MNEDHLKFYDTALTHHYSPDEMRAFTEKRASQFVSNPDGLENPPSCEGCGVCCYVYWVEVASWETYVPAELIVESEEIEKLIKSKSLAEHMKGRLWMARSANGACIALLNGKCTIYNDRPHDCRVYPVGGSRCIEQRNKFGFENNYGEAKHPGCNTKSLVQIESRKSQVPTSARFISPS